MIETTATLRRKIDSAHELQAVVRTMKAMAASSIGQYEKSVSSLGNYYHAVELGLGECFRATGREPLGMEQRTPLGTRGVVVFGSDQGLVGRFNDTIADYAIRLLADLPGQSEVFAVGERVNARLVAEGLCPVQVFSLPNAVDGIAPLIGEVLLCSDKHHSQRELGELHLFYNRPAAESGYTPSMLRLLPLDAIWQRQCVELPWPPGRLPEIIGHGVSTLRALIREYLFVSLFRACAESLASENASRLAAMQRAEKNIEDLLVDLMGDFHRFRQSVIDEELFEVISGFEALSSMPKRQ
ncbi:MAG: F0F1 ATP synthase subunit gamma [Pseudomonadales bacterium]|nr:F0F1 ATP synthase subunit gamma [Pseudomonadales bacterium]